MKSNFWHLKDDAKLEANLHLPTPPMFYVLNTGFKYDDSLQDINLKS